MFIFWCLWIIMMMTIITLCQCHGSNHTHHGHIWGKFPPCSDLSVGRWVNIADIIDKPDLLSRHLYNDQSGIRDILLFNMTWLPTNCSYHRFTNESMHRLVDHIIDKSKSDKTINILPTNQLALIFVGDSTTRGLFCSISRILAGSEVFGAVNNAVCGGDWFNYLALQVLNQWVDVPFGNILLKFNFEKSLLLRHMDWAVEMGITNTPYALTWNTGPWDFDGYGTGQIRKPENIETCNNDTFLEKISSERASHEKHAVVKELGWLAREKNVHAVYRNNHYNNRFGVLCADEKVERMLNGTGWTVLDTRNISRDVWTTNLMDGLHFDRKNTHNTEELINERNRLSALHELMPGMLEMQITQHFLNLVFYEHLVEFFYHHHPGEDNTTSNSGDEKKQPTSKKK